MYMTLSDLQKKFKDEKSLDFVTNFLRDAEEVGVTSVLQISKKDSGGEYLYTVDEDALDRDINLLNEYVEVVQAILAHSDSYAYSRAPLYLQAPFYEGYFEVDPNTRIITPAKDFKANGIGVSGDHLAEILWFHMPRFFDVTDLYKCAQPGGSIRILWRNLASVSKLAHQSKPVAVMPYGDDLYFGWYVTEATTEAAGNIEFALEFVINDPETAEPTFRLYTQSAIITVKSGLNLENLDPTLEDVTNRLYDRPLYSGIVNSLTAAAPVIVKDLPTNGGYDELGNELDLDLLVHEPVIEVDPDTQEETVVEAGGEWFDFEIDAKVPDEKTQENPEGKNTLIYNWVWNGAVVTDLEDVNNKNRLPGAECYELVEPKDLAWSDPAPDGLTYKKLKTNVPGTYQVFVGNRTTDNAGIHYVQSKQAYIAPADEIRVDSSALPNVKYLDSRYDANPRMSIVVKTAKGETPNGVLTYQWFRGRPDDNIADTPVETSDARTNSFNPLSAANTLGINDSSLRGWYYVEATNTKNNTMTHAKSTPVWVESVPMKIAESDLALAKADGTRGRKWTLTVDNNRAGSYEGATYEYYVRLHAQIATQNGGVTSYEARDFDVNLNSPHNNGNTFRGDSVTFSLEDISLDDIPAGTQYDLEVFVVPYVLPEGETKARYAMTLSSTGLEIKDYTEIQAVQQIMQE